MSRIDVTYLFDEWDKLTCGKYSEAKANQTMSCGYIHAIVNSEHGLHTAHVHLSNFDQFGLAFPLQIPDTDKIEAFGAMGWDSMPYMYKHVHATRSSLEVQGRHRLANRGLCYCLS